MISRWAQFLLLVSSARYSLSSTIVPPLYRYDDHEQCLQSNSKAVYCVLVINLKTDTVDPLDSIRIELGFRRNELEWGVCVADCEQELAGFSESERQRWYYAKFTINHRNLFPTNYWPEKVEPYNLTYGKLLNSCVNNRLQRDYNLTQLGYSEIGYCIHNDPPERQNTGLDWLTVLFLAIVITLTTSTVGASAIDLFAGNVVVSSFAVKRNWMRLLQDPKTEFYRDFVYIDGLRVLINICTLALHCSMLGVNMSLDNPEYVEKINKNRLTLVIASMTPISVQNFFVISGMLLTVHFLRDIQRTSTFDLGYVRTKIINRLIRLVPVYYFFLLFSLVGDGLVSEPLSPNGQKNVILEQRICWKHGWKNFLFVNNLPANEEKCFTQGCYLAADQQLFIAALFLLALIWKFPRKTKALLWMVVIVSVIIPATLVHLLSLESVLPVRLCVTKFLQYYQPFMSHIYQTSYCNIHAYIAGIIVGFLYHQTRYCGLNLDGSRLYNLVKKAPPLLIILGPIPAFLYYEYEIPRPSWPTTLHFVLYHNFGVVFGSLCFIHCFRNPPGQLRQFLSSRSMTSLGKLSYSVYVLHMPLLRWMINYIPVMVQVSFPKILMLFTATVFASYLLGLAVYLVIEQPMCLLLRHLFFETQDVKSELKAVSMIIMVACCVNM
ncbi:regulator of hypoxia-inducible factor 1-like isoform X2 [Topomyia yanbarensis]|uniref:regulator of hypoxia-inducible factor 1-like isoform X2 n=1 Tax=Topomyia yanbarensis TaxID=2498891 RepID=UPI00273C5EDF|nr:regulator of hypoxia-inducible factor 1-like isoform X2 [Topomyia yanbarensis]